MNKLKVLDCFAGIGGFSLGLHKTQGFTTSAFVEIDKHCKNVLNKNFPGIPVYSDIKGIYQAVGGLANHDDNSFITEKIDVITGGWPCQGISVAGKKKGLSDERSGLWKDFKRVIKEVEPTWVILENSPNLRNLGLARVLQDLWEIGYHNIRWDILSAEAYGAIHKRERIYIVANRNGYGLSEATYAPTEEASRRGTKTRIDFSSRRCPEPQFYRMADGTSNESYETKYIERERKQRVKQCGNGIYIPIIEEIGKYIIKVELDRLNKT